MEHLTKQQIILLALFVSFFSSIATGIVVVSLMDQSTPAPTVIQTVNRIVERTIEKPSPTAPAGKETIIVKDDQAIVDAIASATKSIVRITEVTPGSAEGRFIGNGVIVSSSGRVVSAAKVATADERLVAYLSGGNSVSLAFLSTDQATGLSVFQAEQSSDPLSARAYTPAALGDSDSLKLGQAAVIISGDKTPIVATGIISSLAQEPAVGPQSAHISRVLASASGMASFDSYAILVNLLGEVVGMKDGSDITAAGASFIPSNLIKLYATPSTLHN